MSGMAKNNLSALNLGLRAVLSLLFLNLASAYQEYVGDFKCSVPEAYTDAELQSVSSRNCVYVSAWQSEVAEAINKGLHEIVDRSEEQRAQWEARSGNATEACQQVATLNAAGSFREATSLAVNAWGSIVRQGASCCTLLNPPFCVDQDWSASTVALMVPIAFLVLLLLGAILASCRGVPPKERASLSEDSPGHAGDRSESRMLPAVAASVEAMRVMVTGKSQLHRDLEKAWLQSSCLRVLPDAEPFAISTASLFDALTCTFQFQEDNARNQFEHLISLLRSQLSMVADRAYEEEGRQVNEQDLLREALSDLHAELLDGFIRWRRQYYECADSGMKEKEGLPCMCGVKWEPLGKKGGGEGADEELCRKLAEVSAFLLVWGEAGNLRFMPEVVYFITDLVLVCEPFDLKDLYQLPGEPPRQSGLFLSQIVRPIYNMIFDEWYDKVDVNAANQKDVKKLRDGFDAYLPADAANYDDWNEFFCDPQRVSQGLILQEGTPLFEHQHGRRFRQLSLVDWEISLQASSTKTHNELHSLWGVFAGTHRVCLLHMLMFAISLCIAVGDPPEVANGEYPLAGDKVIVRFAAIGLLVPFHALAWAFAEWQITGPALRSKWGRCGPLFRALRTVRDFFRAVVTKPMCGCPDTGKSCLLGFFRRPPLLFFLLPLVTFALLRKSNDERANFLNVAAAIHYVVSAVGLFYLLLVPSSRYNRFPFEAPVSVPISSRVIRYGFWGFVLAVKFFLGLVIVGAISDAMRQLNITRPGHESEQELRQVYFSATWGDDVLLWTVLWGANFTLYLADTQLWFTVFCTFLGVATTFYQRHMARNNDAFSMSAFMWEDAVAKIPQRFSQKVLCYTSVASKAGFSDKFPAIWDRIVEYMRYEDKVSNAQMGDMSFEVGASGHQVHWADLAKPVGHRRQGAPGTVHASSATTGATYGLSSAGDVESGTVVTTVKVKAPNMFVPSPFAQRCLQTYAGVPNKFEPQNADIQWRMLALSRGLGLPMPRPYRAPYIPGITVLIPHYGETILMQKKELFNKDKCDNVPLVDWLSHKYQEEFEFFTNRMQAQTAHREPWPVVGAQWADYNEYQWERVSNWAAMRQQTLFRTVAGMCYYYPAIQAHFELQGDRTSSLAKVWDASDVFTCMVSMQMYKFFDKTMLQHTNYMFDKFPTCLKVAFIDCDAKGATGGDDNVHKRQKRRYYSCLIDKSCPLDGDRRKPRFRIELPGFPILGDGKGDNQNHAIPFMRGHYSQGIDANQGAYFEQMLLLPCALGEFRAKRAGDGSGKKILGFPEHITSDIGSVGDMAASAEVAFGTILQRTYCVLGARMHYGHPDIMNKLYMMQQGGVSKATKTLNLSEDIFAGMDFTLRGDGRQIKHCEYLNLAKGRDLGFNTVLGFFSKLSSGTGEQILTRQMFRLSQVLHLPEALAFYYAHAGYYLNQFIVSWSMPMLVFVWLLVLLSDCENSLGSLMTCHENQQSAAEIMASALATAYSWLLLLFLFATSFPLFAELWMQHSLKRACWKMLQSYLTLSPFLFIFQAKCIGHYIVNEFRYGGATYVATGRGLPTERRPFVGEMKPRSEGYLRMAKVGGLYLDYARISYYDGAMLLVALGFVFAAGGVPNTESLSALSWTFVSCGLTLIAWLYGPFIFNPYQFVWKHFKEDARALCAFFLENNGSNWLEWYSRTQLKAGQGLHKTLLDITFFGFVFVVAAWYATVSVKIELFAALFTEYSWLGGYELLYLTVLLPPVFMSLAFCLFVVILESLAGCSSSVRRSVDARKKRRQSKRRETAASGDERPEDLEAGVERHKKAEDFAAKAPAPARMETSAVGDRVRGFFGCNLGVPLPAMAVIVVLMDACEVAAPLLDIYKVGWTNTLLAGIILKLILLSAAIMLGEGIIRSNVFARITACWAPLGIPLETWVRAHRMARDIFTSLLIFLPLGFFVATNSLNELLCPSCNLHFLLLYRDPGHSQRQEHILELEVEGSPSPTSPPQQSTMPGSPPATEPPRSPADVPRSPTQPPVATSPAASAAAPSPAGAADGTGTSDAAGEPPRSAAGLWSWAAGRTRAAPDEPARSSTAPDVVPPTTASL